MSSHSRRCNVILPHCNNRTCGGHVEGERRKEKGGRRKEEGGRMKEEGGMRKEEGRRKEEGGINLY